MITQNELNKIKQDMAIAIKKGWDSTKIEWRKAALKIVYALCTQEPTITANDFTETIKAMSLKTHDNRAIGGVVKIAKKFRWIAKTGEIEVSKAGHLSRIQVWKSLLFGKVEEESEVLIPKMEWNRSQRTFIDLGDGKFVVNGTRGKQYRVINLRGIWTCECEAFKYGKGKHCRHIKMVITFRKKKELKEAMKNQKSLFQKV